MSDSIISINQRLSEAFHKDSSKILAILIKLYGPHNMIWAEDTLQDTFTKAMLHWQSNGLPENPTAWLVLAAKRSAIDKLRNIKIQREHHKTQILAPELSSDWTLTGSVERHFETSNFADEELRLLFWVASTDLPENVQLPLMLKTLCGLSSEAICRALLENTETIKKRLQRARSKLSKQPFELPSESDTSIALGKVHLALYLLFNEGISPRNPSPDKHINLCIEALGLSRLIIESESLRNQESLALFSLMHFHYARLPARKNGDFLSIPIDEQDRQKWHSHYLVKAVQLLSSALASQPSSNPRFLLEALIAHEHCRAKSFALTDWQTIIQHYDSLYNLSGSPVVIINRAVAIAHAGNIELAISHINALIADKTLAKKYQVSATMAYLFVMNNDVLSANSFYNLSLEQGLSVIEAEVLKKRIARIAR